MTDLKRWQYGPAEAVAERQERYNIRETNGCAACIYRETEFLPGHWTCGINQSAGKRGFCKRWDVDNDAEALK